MSISGPRRLAVLVSCVWISVFLLLSLTDDQFPLIFFLSTGVAPVGLLWGIVWVIAGFRR